MIGYLFLALGTAGTAAVLYYVAPAARGTHRYVVPRATLRTGIARLEGERDTQDGKLLGITAELNGTYDELRDALIGKESAEQRVTDLEDQLKDYDAVRAENTRLTSALANATAMRQLLPGPSPADDASALPDELQQFADQTSAAWRARA
jgi:predicted  nucleic acid-binding Zn-ribbon protein